MSIALVHEQALFYFSNRVLKLGKLVEKARACGDNQTANAIEDYIAFHLVPMCSNSLLAGLNSMNDDDRNALHHALCTAERVEEPKKTAA